MRCVFGSVKNAGGDIKINLCTTRGARRTRNQKCPTTGPIVTVALHCVAGQGMELPLTAAHQAGGCRTPRCSCKKKWAELGLALAPRVMGLGRGFVFCLYFVFPTLMITFLSARSIGSNSSITQQLSALPRRPHTHTHTNAQTHTHTHTHTHTRWEPQNKNRARKAVKKHVYTLSGGPYAGSRKQQADKQQTASDWCSGLAATWVYQIISLHQRAPSV